MITPPESVNGLPVVLAVCLPDVDGLVYGRHVVICRDRAVTPGREFVVWTAAPADGFWEVYGSGRYDLPWDAAVDVLAERCKRAFDGA